MMKYECTEERVLSDIQNHEMIIVRDDGFDRHIRFRNKGRGAYWFDLITWDGYLCIAGDCGTYVFRRIPDMFNFFIMSDNDFNSSKKKKLNINTGYWEEKCVAQERHGGIKEFCTALFAENVKEQFDEYFEDGEHDEFKDDCWAEIQMQVIGAEDNEIESMQAAMDFEHSDSGFQMQDFWELNCRQYTFHYVWCLYAIVWGILKYNKIKENK